MFKKPFNYIDKASLLALVELKTVFRLARNASPIEVAVSTTRNKKKQEMSSIEKPTAGQAKIRKWSFPGTLLIRNTTNTMLPKTYLSCRRK